MGEAPQLIYLQAQMQLYVGRLLLLLPIVGDFNTQSANLGFIPPRPDVLFGLAQSKNFPRPMNVEIHVGVDDWQSNSVNVQTFADPLNIKVT
jgi:hypothetical protein